MSGDAHITGEIRIEPPITWGELHAERWALAGDGRGHYPDAVVRVESDEEITPDGVLQRHRGVAIIPEGGETSARTLLADVDRIVKRFGFAPDGTQIRTFTGFLHVVWGDGEAIYRVVVRDGAAVEVRPEVVWPADAQDVTP